MTIWLSRDLFPMVNIWQEQQREALAMMRQFGRTRTEPLGRPDDRSNGDEA